MPATKQSQAVAVANEYLALAEKLQRLYLELVSLNQRYNNLNVDAIWTAIPTVALNPDGSIGAADGSSKPGNVMDTSKLGSLLSRAVSHNDLVNLVTHAQALQKFFDGSGAVATVDRRPVIDPLCGGA